MGGTCKWPNISDRTLGVPDLALRLGDRRSDLLSSTELGRIRSAQENERADISNVDVFNRAHPSIFISSSFTYACRERGIYVNDKRS